MPKYQVRHPRGNYWTCDVRRKESNRKADEKRRADPDYRRKKNLADLTRNKRDYESSPVFRITRLMREARRKKQLRRERTGDTAPVNPAIAASLDTLLERIPTYEEVRRGKVSL